MLFEYQSFTNRTHIRHLNSGQVTQKNGQLTYFNANCNSIQKQDESGIQMVEICLIVKWSGFQMLSLRKSNRQSCYI